MNRTKLDIYSYTDHRRFIADRLDELKVANPKFSRRYFMRKLGLSSSNYFKRLIDGARRLSDDLARRLASGLGLNVAESAFFLDLVRFTQARGTRERAEALDLLRRHKRFLHVHQLELDRFDYFTDPLALALRGMVDLADFSEEPSWIAGRLPFAVTPRRIREALDRLIRDGHLKRDAKGRLVPAHRHEEAGERLGNLHLRQYHLNMLESAAKAMELPPSTRLFSGLSLSIPRAVYPTIVTEILEFRERLRQIVDNDDPTEEVYHLEMALFPLTKPAACPSDPGDGKKKKTKGK